MCVDEELEELLWDGRTRARSREGVGGLGGVELFFVVEPRGGVAGSVCCLICCCCCKRAVSWAGGTEVKSA